MKNIHKKVLSQLIEPVSHLKSFQIREVATRLRGVCNRKDCTHVECSVARTIDKISNLYSLIEYVWDELDDEWRDDNSPTAPATRQPAAKSAESGEGRKS